ACAGGHMAENQFFRGPTTKHHGQSSHQVVTRICITVIERELLSHSQRHSSGNDRDFVDRIGAGEKHRNQCVPALVISGVLSLGQRHPHRAPLGAHHDLVLGELEVRHLDLFLVAASSQKRGFVYEIFEIGSCKPGGGACQLVDSHVFRKRYPPSVDLQNSFP